MKNRNLDHKNDWATPPYIIKQIEDKFGVEFEFDPCPFMHDTSQWDGLEVEWGNYNFVNPPYSLKLKTKFVLKGIEEMKKGKTSLFLLPVSTGTKLFHDYILPNIDQGKNIWFVKGRIPFIGVNTKGQYVNWHLWDKEPPEDAEQVRNSGMHDSMIITFSKQPLDF